MTRLKEIYNYSKNSTADQFYEQNFLARAEFVDIIYEEFKVLHNEIMSLINSDTQFETQDKQRGEADTYLYAIKGKVMELALRNSNSSSVSTSKSASSSGTKLPKINVPVFEGNIKSWAAFNDL